MNILALDLATRTGWAHSCGESGVQDFSPRRGDSPGMKWLAVRAWLNRVADMAQIDLIAYEQTHHRGGAATHSGHAMIAIVEAFAAEKQIQITSRHTGTIKKYATGKGNADKVAMLSAARSRWGRVIDDNHADALWLLALVTSEMKGC